MEERVILAGSISIAASGTCGFGSGFGGAR